MSNKYDMEKSDIGEMLVIATHALNSGQKQVTLNSDDAVHVLELAYNHETLTEQVRQLRELNREFAEFAKRQGWQHVLIDEHYRLSEATK